ncbi:bifunctional riboflavin kinase/FAD synthetase [Campylobacter novaezeelandiae]|uniref:bifunctional riboflavin kinase/FAD synthetase n=1 Tax=Campylobacter novaezeelandiae TaxID=2267891 RepID=UPI0021CFE022|nr:bifunctional riboflavin kinase/FAD synthetase [Campylobacter novaezeelandiae]
MSISTTIVKDKVKSLAIGSFDGIHLGHKKLIDYLDDQGILLIIDKFKGKKLCTNQDKFCLTKKEIVELDFKDIKTLDGKEFLQFLKKEFRNLKLIIVGYDFSFGKNRAYKANDIEMLSGIKTIIVDEFSINGVGVHTSLIKEYLKQGDIKKANSFLGRNYGIKGRLIKGQGLGSKELFATLNLECKDYFLPKDGVYATFIKFKNQSYKSVSFIGIRSSDNNFSIESHILEEFDDELKLHEILELEFVDYIRENQKFEDLNKLKNQISKDIQKAKEILKDEK